MGSYRPCRQGALSELISAGYKSSSETTHNLLKNPRELCLSTSVYRADDRKSHHFNCLLLLYVSSILQYFYFKDNCQLVEDTETVNVDHKNMYNMKIDCFLIASRASDI